MTTERIRAACVALLIVSACVSIAISCATTTNRTGDSLDTSQYPPDVRDAYKVFAVRCSRCHTLARPLNARIRDPQQWVRYVARMRLNPASGINAKNGEIILRFLLYYMHQREREHGDQSTDSELVPETTNGEMQPGAADDSVLEDGPKPVSKGDTNEVGTPDHQASETEAVP